MRRWPVSAMCSTWHSNSSRPAEASVYLATLGPDGPSGLLWGHLWTADGPADAYGPLPW